MISRSAPERRARKRQFKAALPERWAAAEAGVTTTLVLTPEQQQWPAQRKLLFDSTDGTVHRIVHVGWHEEHRCVVSWFHQLSDASTVMPKVAGRKLDQDECSVANMQDTAAMMADYQDALVNNALPFEPDP